MKKILSCFFISFFTTLYSYSQDVYKDSLNKYITQYVKEHKVVTGDDKQYFHFFPVDEKYRVTARFEKVVNSKWFTMETSGPIKKTFRVYGILYFTIHDTAVKLNLYQSQNLMTTSEYKNYLFLPFTDISSGEETYAAGRYIDLSTEDIVDNKKVILDFNKAYNPYCAYVSGKYNCPISPKENQLTVAIHAGEKIFAQPH